MRLRRVGGQDPDVGLPCRRQLMAPNPQLPTLPFAATPRPMKILGLDIGTRRIGVACSDASGRLASPLATIEVAGDASQAADTIAAIASREAVSSIVCGLPVEMSGRDGFASRRTRQFTDLLATRTSVPITFVDERLSSAQAGRQLRENGISGRRQQRPVIDQAAAVIILQAWLDRSTP